MDKKFKDIGERVADICRRHGCSKRSGTAPDFPRDSQPDHPKDFPVDLWRDLGRKNLMGIVVPEQYKGLGLGLDALATVTEQLVISGASMGFALTFLIHQLVCHHFIITHADKCHRDALLPSMASGEVTAAFAVSEPGVSAHPKYLKTRAKKKDQNFIITGEKSFVTNAPLADLFIVIAVTGIKNNRNLFSAFIVPRQTRGLTVGKPMDIGRLYPCPHASLTLERCSVKQTYVTGKSDFAFETMVIPFKRLEELMVPVIVSGAMINLFKTLGARLPANLQKSEAPALEAMACRLSQMAHSSIKEYMNHRNYDFPRAKTREFARRTEQSRQYFRNLMQRTKIPPDRDQDQFDRDLTTFLGLFH